MELKKEFGINYSNLKGSLAILFTAIFLLSIVPMVPVAHADPGHGLVLWNKLGSQTEIENSEVGLDGTFSGGGFVGGMFGNAYSADHTQDLLVTFPKEVIPIDAGTIEFWAKLTGFPSCMEWREKPYFVNISDGYSRFALGFNGNDGGGNGGLVGQVGHGFKTGTGPYRSPSGGTCWTYEEVLGTGQVEAWHHYALVWDENGIAGVGDGTKKVAVFLDGQLNSGIWYDYFGGDSELVPLTGGELGLIMNNMSQGSAAIDNLIIWNYAKTDFSDRFTEGMIVSCDAMGKEKNQFEPGECVYAKGIRLESSTTYRIWIQSDPVSEGDLLTVTEDPSGFQEVITTNVNGDFSPEPIWTIPSYAPPTYDKFDIVVDKLNDGGNTGYYNAASDGLDSATVVGFVAPVPEFPTMAIPVVTILGLLFLISRRRRK